MNFYKNTHCRKVKSWTASLDFPELQGVFFSSLSFVWPLMLIAVLMKFQGPSQADTVIRVQQELKETKVVRHRTVKSILQRGKKLDQLVERSDVLSAQS